MKRRFFGLIAVSALFLLTGCELNIGNSKNDISTIQNAEEYYADGNLTFDSDSMYPKDGKTLPKSYASYEIQPFPAGSILRARLAKYITAYNVGDVIVFKDKSLVTDEYDGTNVQRIVDINDGVYILQADKTASVMYYYTEELAAAENMTDEEKATANKYLLDNDYITTITKGSILAKVESVVLPD